MASLLGRVYMSQIKIHTHSLTLIFLLDEELQLGSGQNKSFIVRRLSLNHSRKTLFLMSQN